MATKQSEQKGATQKKSTADKSTAKTAEKSQKMDKDSKKTPGRH